MNLQCNEACEIHDCILFPFRRHHGPESASSQGPLQDSVRAQTVYGKARHASPQRADWECSANILGDLAQGHILLRRAQEYPHILVGRWPRRADRFWRLREHYVVHIWMASVIVLSAYARGALNARKRRIRVPARRWQKSDLGRYCMNCFMHFWTSLRVDSVPTISRTWGMRDMEERGSLSRKLLRSRA
jgi:hypothetical protein